MDLVVDRRLTIPGSELRLSFSRAGGPGGQHVNKVASKVELRWNPAASAALSSRDRAWLLRRLAGRLTADGDLVVTSRAHRDQHRNRDDARHKLAAIVRDALHRPTPRRRTRPTRSAIERRLRRKQQRSHIKRARRDPGDDS